MKTPELLPNHLAIIMDGNGRWAKARGHHRVFGHIRGAKVAKAIIEECARLGVPHLTLFTFSTENWLRPVEEVSFLMHLLTRRLRRECETLIANNIRFRTIGDLNRLPAFAKRAVEETTQKTAHCTGMNLVFALSYGGRQELVDTVKALATRVAAGQLSPQEIDEVKIGAQLESAFLPDPDLIVRTSGEHRLSNFFLWQAAYSEILFEPQAWPDYSIADLHRALQVYAQRERRYGRTGEQLETESLSLHE